MNKLPEEQRQDKRALIVIFFNLIYKLAKMFWPILLVFIFKKSSAQNTTGQVLGLYIPLGILFLTALLSFLNYWFFKYQLTASEFKIRKGFFKVSRMSVPLERIQTVNISQNLIQRMLNIVSVEIDTAGAKESEVKLLAISKEKAEELQKQLKSQYLETKEENRQEASEVSEISKVSEASKKDSQEQLATRTEDISRKSKPIYISLLDTLDLLKIALSYNHFKSFLAIIALPFILLSEFYNIFENEINQLAEQTAYRSQTWSYSLLILSFCFIVVLSFLISFARIFIHFYNFKSGLQDEQFFCRHGLFKTQETNIPKGKIQFLIWHINPVRTWLKQKGLELKIAVSGQKKKKESALVIPACKPQEEEKWYRYLLNISKDSSMEEKVFSLPFYFIRKFIVQNSIMAGSLLVLFLLIKYTQPDWFIGLRQIIPENIQTGFGILLVSCTEVFIIISLLLSRKKYYFQHDQQILKISKGAIAQRIYFIKMYKIQSVSLQQSIFMQRRQAYHLILHTASGKISIPYIEAEKAHFLYRFLLYRIESSSEEWM